MFGDGPVQQIAGLNGANVVMASGDYYEMVGGDFTTWALVGNVFTGSPTTTHHQSWSDLKARYRNTPSISVAPGAQNK